MKCHHCEKVFKGKCDIQNVLILITFFLNPTAIRTTRKDKLVFTLYVHTKACISLQEGDQNAASGITSLPGAEEHAFSNLMVLLTLPLSTDCI